MKSEFEVERMIDCLREDIEELKEIYGKGLITLDSLCSNREFKENCIAILEWVLGSEWPLL